MVRVTCAALLVLLAFAAYSYRLHEITRQFELLLDERIGERTRLARELHDTLCRVFRASCSASRQFTTCSLAALEKQFNSSIVFSIGATRQSQKAGTLCKVCAPPPLSTVT